MGVGQRAHGAVGTSFPPPPAQVAGTWHSEAVAASNISLLDAESRPAPSGVYTDELRPIPRDWRSWRSSCRNDGHPSHPQQITPSLGCGPARAGLLAGPSSTVGGTRAPGSGDGAHRSQCPWSPAQGFRPHGMARGSVWGDARVEAAGQLQAWVLRAWRVPSRGPEWMRDYSE